MWRHRDGLADPPLSLHDIQYEDGALHYPSERHTAGEEALAGYLTEAERIFTDAEAAHPAAEHIELGEGFEALRWFPVPEEL